MTRAKTRTILTHAEIVDGTSPERRGPSDVLIEDGLIAEVSDRPITAADAAVVDLHGRTLMPGLTDAHVHIVANSLSLSAIDELPPSFVALSAGACLKAMLMRGFTTVRDAGGADWGYASAVESGLIPGPRLLVSGRALSQTGGHGDLRSRHPDSAMGCACAVGRAPIFSRIADGVPAVRQAARDELRLGAAQIKIMASGGVASPADPVWMLQYAEDEIAAIVAEARAWRTYVLAHAFTPEAISRAVKLGVRSIEHGNLLNAAAAADMAKNDAFLVPTLVTAEALINHGKALGFPEASLAKLNEVPWLEKGVEALTIAKAAGVRTGFGTDLLGPLQKFQAREFLIRTEVLSPFEVIRQATTVNAELFNMSGRIGVIAPGAHADLLVLDGDPLADIGVLADPDTRMVGIMKGGVFVKRTF
ncbi:MAG: amidohydrolase family protein [Alphaproteobacteria bacterium]|nr:amidohydrolase family protein [Alphaproteobacteria bacterium]